MTTKKLLYSECLKVYEVDKSFVDALIDAGLIQILDEDNHKFIEDDSLSAIEQFIRWHYDLNINLEGIEALHHMLQRVRTMQEKIEQLENELNFYKAL